MNSMKCMQQRASWRIVSSVAVVAIVTAACGGGDSRSRREIRGPAAPAAGGGAQASGPKKLDPATAGTISGSVKWEGAKPTPKPIDVSGNPDCVKASKETIYEEALVVNANDTVRNCIVSIESTDAYEPSAEPVVIDQRGCRYIPHVFALQTGQKLKIKSSDPTLHNVHVIPTGDVNDESNDAMNTGAPDRIKIYTAADWLKIKCEVHPWMSAWCSVKTHPFFAVTGDDGTFTIKNVPPGTHKLVLKHEKLGEQSASITVETGKTATHDFTLKQ
jgi:plastocyanin